MQSFKANENNTLRNVVLAIIGVWSIIPIFLGIWKLVLLLLTPGLGQSKRSYSQMLNAWYFTGGISGSAVRNSIIVVLMIITGIIVIIGIIENNDSAAPSPTTGTLLGGLIVLFAIILVFSLTESISQMVNGGKDAAKYYSSATTFYMDDLKNPPSSLLKLIDNNQAGKNGCALGGPKGDDVPVCIKQGGLPEGGFEPRVGSLDGAIYVMTNGSGNVAGTNIDKSTLTYLNSTTSRKAMWSAIRDGSGKSQPMISVVQWTGGKDNPTECSFENNYKINRAISGQHKNDLFNYLGEKYPAVNFNASDAWGYCDTDNHPVIVFPVTKQVDTRNQTARSAAGIVIMHGSASGKPVLEYHSSIKAGEFFGPVYPSSLLDKQMAAVEWAAGKGVKNNSKFGFDPTNYVTQEGNDSDYLLEGAGDHRLYWVTPLTPHKSDSQQFITYAITPADEVASGSLNALNLYSLNDKDPRVVNLNNLATDATQYLIVTYPGFKQGGGKLVEFLPTSSGHWRAFGEVGGRVYFSFDVATNGAQISQPVVIPLNDSFNTVLGASATNPANTDNSGTTGSTPVVINCGGDITKKNSKDLLACISKITTELAKRQK